MEALALGGKRVYEIEESIIRRKGEGVVCPRDGRLGAACQQVVPGALRLVVCRLRRDARLVLPLRRRPSLPRVGEAAAPQLVRRDAIDRVARAREEGFSDFDAHLPVAEALAVQGCAEQRRVAGAEGEALVVEDIGE